MLSEAVRRLLGKGVEDHRQVRRASCEVSGDLEGQESNLPVPPSEREEDRQLLLVQPSHVVRNLLELRLPG